MGQVIRKSTLRLGDIVEPTTRRFVSLVVPPSPRQSTPVIKRSLNPVFPKDSSTFDFPLYLSLAGVVGGRGLEGVVWDKVRSRSTSLP